MSNSNKRKPWNGKSAGDSAMRRRRSPRPKAGAGSATVPAGDSQRATSSDAETAAEVPGISDAKQNDAVDIANTTELPAMVSDEDVNEEAVTARLQDAAAQPADADGNSDAAAESGTAKKSGTVGASTRKKKTAPSPDAPGAVRQRTAGAAYAQTSRRHKALRLIALCAVVVVVAVAIAAVRITHLAPADYLDEAKSLAAVQTDITAVANSYGQINEQLVSDSSSVTDDTLGDLRSAVDTLKNDTSRHADDKVFKHDADAADSYAKFSSAVDDYAAQVLSFADAAPKLAAAVTACSGSTTSLSNDDTDKFMDDYSAYLSACETAVDDLDASTDSEDITSWIESVDKYLDTQKTTVSAIQGLGNTDSMSSATFSQYLTKLSDLAGQLTPSAGDVVTSVSSSLDSADPSTALHDVENYLYGKSAQ